MTEETNDMIPADPGKNLPVSLETHLRGIIPETDLHQFREQLPSAFLTDASEGLQQLKDSNQLDIVLKQLNHLMHQQLTLNKTHNKKRAVGNLSWAYWAIIIILLLTFAGYVVIRLLLHH